MTLTAKNSRIKPVKDKRILKGGRIQLYPKNMRIFRHSRGIKQPHIERTTRKSALQIVDTCNADLKYRNCFIFFDDITNYSNAVFKEYYDCSAASQTKVKFFKSYQIGKYWCTLYSEMVAMCQLVTEYQEYYEPPHVTAMVELHNILN